MASKSASCLAAPLTTALGGALQASKGIKNQDENENEEASLVYRI
jgi:hypothetical protein